MHITFRCDANATLGAGHLRRCAVLAGEALEHNNQVSFLIRTEGNPIWSRYVPVGVRCEIRKGHPFDQLRELAEWIRAEVPDILVVDHYSIIAEHALDVSRLGVPWMMFDNARSSDAIFASIVHNALPGPTKADYRFRVGKAGVQLLIGPDYALLRPEFRNVLVNPQKHLAILFGGGYDHGLILRCLKSLASELTDWHRTVLTTSANESLPAIREWIDENDPVRVSLLVDEPEVARHLAQVSVAITAAGTTLNELACLGVPAITVAVAENQIPSGERWAQAGAVRFLGPAEAVSESDLRAIVIELASDDQQRILLSQSARRLVDGLGAKRTLAAILNVCNKSA